MHFAVKLDLVFLRILLSMVKIREASVSIIFCLKNIIDKSFCIEGKFSSSSRVSMCWIIHLVKLMTVVVISIHRPNQSLNVVLLFKSFFDFLTEVAFTGCSCSSNPDEWNNIIRRFANNLYNIIRHFVGNLLCDVRV